MSLAPKLWTPDDGAFLADLMIKPALVFINMNQNTEKVKALSLVNKANQARFLKKLKASFPRFHGLFLDVSPKNAQTSNFQAQFQHFKSRTTLSPKNPARQSSTQHNINQNTA